MSESFLTRMMNARKKLDTARWAVSETKQLPLFAIPAQQDLEIAEAEQEACRQIFCGIAPHLPQEEHRLR